MTREQISQIVEGITKEQLDAILDLNSADIGKAKGDLDTVSASLEAANNTIADLQAAVKQFDGVDVAALHQQITDLQSRYDQDTEALRLQNAVDVALIQAGARNPRLARAALDLSAIRLEDGKLTGYDEQIAALRESDGYLFSETTVTPVGTAITDPARPGETFTPDQVEHMSPEQYKQWRNTHA